MIAAAESSSEGGVLGIAAMIAATESSGRGGVRDVAAMTAAAGAAAEAARKASLRW